MQGFAASVEQDATHDTSHAQSLEAAFSVENIRCAACAWLIERRLLALPGVQRATLNLTTERLLVCWDSARCKPSDLLAALLAIGFCAVPFDPARHDEQLQRKGRKLFRQLFVAGLCMMQVMMYAAPAYIATDGTMDADMAALMRWASLLLTLPALCYCALPFFQGAWANLKARMLGMDVPVAIGIAAAFGGSAAATVSGQGEVYFDSVTMFIFLLLCSRYLELYARRKAASALNRLQHSVPAHAFHVPGYPAQRSVQTVAASRLRPDDVILIKPGETVPADCVIVEGQSSLDMSLLTGESLPLLRQPGDALAGGAINIAQALHARVTRAVRDSTLSSLLRLIERAGQGKPQLALWADKVAAWFVAGLLVLSVAAFLFWHWQDPARAWAIAIAVLVVSCPCALSLATPTALAAATDRLLREGVLVVQPHVMETLHRATHVVFDKTGTLTAGKPQLRSTSVLGDLDQDACLAIAGTLETTSAHPLGMALHSAANARAATLASSNVTHVPGAGVEGEVNGMRYRLGTAGFVSGIAASAEAAVTTLTTANPHRTTSEQDGTLVYLGCARGWLACFHFADAVRPEAADVVAHFLRAGKEVWLLSGDNPHVVERTGSALGIAKVFGDCTPEHKLALVKRLQDTGAIVAMVGDGINDAAVLSAADVSFAMGSGSALAQRHADAVLFAGRLGALVLADKMAAHSLRIIRQNLGWAMVYNLIAIPAAALGLIGPLLAGVGMSISSALVVLNALRLLRAGRGSGAADGARDQLPSPSQARLA